MESFSCTALHFISSVCQLYLIYKVSKGQRMWSINLWVSDCTRERGDGRIYHSLTWQDVLQLSLIEFEWMISVISQWLVPRIRWKSALVCMSLCDLYLIHNHFRSPGDFYFVQVGLIAQHTGLSEVCVCTDGLYSPKVLYECCKARRIQWLCLHRVMNRECMTVWFSGLHDMRSHKRQQTWTTSPRQSGAQRLPKVPWGCIMTLINLNW